MTFLLPPFRTGYGGGAPLDCTRERDCRAAYFGEGPAWFNPHIYVHPAGTACLGPTAQADIVEKRLNLQRNLADIVPTHAGAWIKIDAQLVGMLKISGAHGVRVEFDAAQVDDPGKPGCVIDDDLFGGPPRGE